MPSYALTWNPAEFPYADLSQRAMENRAGARIVISWGAGTRREYTAGDRIFMLRQGTEPRGVFGSGTALGKVTQGPHFNQERAARGDQSYYVPVSLDTLLDP